jgi:circadian clock protein KaiB
MIELKLYICGDTPRSRDALRHIRSNFENAFKDKFILEIVDVLKNPHKADQDGILATPTLLKRTPSPECRIIGDMKDPEKLFSNLKLQRGPLGRC